MDYEYNKEYICNFQKPVGLPNDVEVQISVGESDPVNGYAHPVDKWRWDGVYAFKIVDKRYKPSPQKESNTVNLCDIDMLPFDDSVTLDESKEYLVYNRYYHVCRWSKNSNAFYDMTDEKISNVEAYRECTPPNIKGEEQ